ncbi:MAG: CAAX amino terminal protease self- immunity [Candidatus Lokiarchaeum sp. GC14_75]|nr:MAG: CAAX amino terminal protease self- immunity [Candidatus Lokiarchaeum sp. GC14_75]
MGERRFKFYRLAKYPTYEVLMEGQIASAGAHQARLIEKFKKNKNFIKHQFLTLKIVFSFLFVFLPLIPLVTYMEITDSFGLLTPNSIPFISSLMFGIYFIMTFLYMLMFGMISTSSFMSGNSFLWLQTLPISKKNLKKIAFMTLFRNLDLPLIILIVSFPIFMLIGTQNFLIFLTSILVSFLNVLFNFCLLVLIGQKLSFLFSESKGKSKRVNIVRVLTMLGYFLIAFGSGLILTFGLSSIDILLENFKTNEPPILFNIILSLIPFPFAPGYLLSLSSIPNQFPSVLLLSTLIGITFFIILIWRLYMVAIHALRRTISTETEIVEVKKKTVKVEVKPKSSIRAYLRKDLISATRDIQSFMFLFFPIFYPLIMVFTLQGPIIGGVASVEGILILWSIIVGVYLFIPPMLIIGFLNIEESGSSILASLPILSRDQAKAKIVLMSTIQGISLTLTSIILSLITGSVLVLFLFLLTLPIAWIFLILMFEMKIRLFGQMKNKYILEELHKENKILKWLIIILSDIGLYLVILVTGSILFFSFGIYITLFVLLIIGIIGLTGLIFIFTRMFPKAEKLVDYVTGGFLREHVNMSIGVLLILYFIFLFLAGYIGYPLFLLFQNLPILSFLSQFLVNFGIFILLWFIIVPLGLKLPKKENFKDFSQTINLSNIKPLWRNILLGVGTLLLFGLSTVILGILLGTWIFDPGILIRNLGWLFLISALIPGIWEEVAFRGVIINLQLKKFTKNTTIILNGVLFGLFHFVNLVWGRDLYSTSMQVIYASCVGISFAYMNIKTGSLLPSMIAHYLIDSVALIFSNVRFPNIVNYTIFQIVGVGIIPMVLIIIFVKLLVPNRYPEIQQS